MPDFYTSQDLKQALRVASAALSARKEEVNRLNVFPVPDGDTGTNMSLTLESVVASLNALDDTASVTELRRAITTGALMGARGNSGVITSQILRGFCEGCGASELLDASTLDTAFARAKEVAFQAVRKPVEGTILTVLKDSAAAARTAHKKKMGIDEALDFVSAEAFASVERTPDLLPVLKEHGVVDAGGFGLAILIEAFVGSLLGRQGSYELDVKTPQHSGRVQIELVNDWEDSQYRYCTEFLVFSESLDAQEGLEFLATMGDCELLVGQNPNFKVHVHTNTPDKVLAYMLERGQISEVHIHNMQLQSQERTEKLAQDSDAQSENKGPAKAIGVVAVAAGEGNAKILKSLGVDVVVSGGQTMNPSTKDLLDAAHSINAESIIFLPNNKNIILAAQSAADVLDCPSEVVATRSIPEAFSALLALQPEEGIEANAEAMRQIIADVITCEITHAIKDSKDAQGNPIKAGDVIGICQGSITVVGSKVSEVALTLLDQLDMDNYDTVTLLAGEDFSDEALLDIQECIEGIYEDAEVQAHRGGQALYPLIFAVE